MTPSIKHLKAFLDVAESGSFISGALRSNMSQPSLSRTIRLLEEEVGARLFDRDTRGSVLTPAGRELVGVATRLVRQTHAEFARFNRFLSGDRGHITIASLPSLSTLLLPDAIDAFSEAFPDVEFSIREAPAQDVETHVLSGSADIGLSVKPTDDELFEWLPLLTDQFGIVMRDDDPLQYNAVCSWRVLQERHFVSHVTSTNACRYLTSALVAAGVNVAPSIMCSEIASAARFVSRGMGVALLPRLCSPLLGQEGLIWRPLGDPVATRRLGALMRPNDTASEAVSALMRSLQQVALALTEARVPEMAV